MMNLDRIAAVAVKECERQGVDYLSKGFGAGGGLVGLLKAYDFAHKRSFHGLPRLADVMEIARYIEPANRGFRNISVTFADLKSTAVDHKEIPDLMGGIFGFMLEENMKNEEVRNEWIKQFLHIHPFEDGNGRTAWILYNWLSGTLDNPVPLPDYFGE